ncbi:hypothetical protein [Nonomuraea sp. NPDC005650]|uniref:hypothetical protein n=1 Tax=Nonomuraea sp. NPDC005650 TaxID=3157045 RepID=UPI0033A41E8B
MNDDVARMCGGKIRHPNRRRALGHLRALAAANKAVDTRLNVYRCPFCLAWHVGHRPR